MVGTRPGTGTVGRVTSAFQVASDYVDEACSLDPVLCTQLGIPGSDGEWGDSFGPAGLAASLALDERYRSLVEPSLDDPDHRERLVARVMLASFDEAKSAFDAGDHLRDLRHMASPLHQIRLVFDVMAVDTPRGRADVARRLETVGVPLGDYRRLLEMGLERGEVVASRQVRSVIGQLRFMSRDPASLDAVVARVTAAGGDNEETTLAAEGARAAFGELADWLEARYLPHAVNDDGVGREVYERSADRLVGMPVDPAEAYDWGWDEFGRLLADMGQLAGSIVPGAGWEAAKEYLETDPAVTVEGTKALLEFASATLDEAVADLAGSHFEVPDVIRPLTVQLAPPGSPLGVYYRRPSEDFSRPGGVWYSIGDQQIFPLYQHVSTAYHEGFPGHHLQIATAMYRREEISRFQHLLTWCPGYGEGWGMYAEVLMGELGYLEDPRHRFGMLAKQMYRTARILVDVGLHLGLSVDDRSPIAPGSKWDFDIAVEFMRVYGFRTPAQANDEVLRYLGWPGQAIAYKLGERELLDIRSDTRRRLGDRFDLREFHATVLNHGTMRLDLLRQLLATVLG
jgi:uncharacterized protein (DUF885 family)